MPDNARKEYHRHNFQHVTNHTAQHWADTFVRWSLQIPNSWSFFHFTHYYSMWNMTMFGVHNFVQILAFYQQVQWNIEGVGKSILKIFYVNWSRKDFDALNGTWKIWHWETWNRSIIQRKLYGCAKSLYFLFLIFFLCECQWAEWYHCGSRAANFEIATRVASRRCGPKVSKVEAPSNSHGQFEPSFLDKS